jgi:hypothetical protein
MKPFSAMLCLATALCCGGCYRLLGNDEGERYFQRKDTVTLSAGDAARVNAMTHTINPWPQGVGDRRIPMEGRRAVSAIECGYLGGKEKADRKAKSETGQTNINFGQQGGGARPQQNDAC